MEHGDSEHVRHGTCNGDAGGSGGGATLNLKREKQAQR